MAPNNLTQLYYKRLMNANARIFELEVMVAEGHDQIAANRPVTAAEEGDDDLRAQLMNLTAQTAAQMEAKDEELLEQKQQIADKDKHISELKKALWKERAT
ncbi:hypothetical protein CLAFUW4_03680 [Fulvia fulva]|uniref:Uncharacterized protein n=1 Tax=Passalora fulva TaxID=5499 RepID=A0A9Q8LAH6_PASFU|nr:uncharacterized protein CLAFUR5_03658 [Fulvia fulva]KAK4632177.1 hypothetical protein CLAFUR4_03668 [Fulvia fulva]KAK4632574.1 hypothetical protein CLAFUR0_03671 [Fulvia fulva]UJO13819.1 hypothetical protein CLAFUR5_03658 [Fulvia fulva]WPV10741.1 hypothetical protein CLAFUW4_03680 [Fulvia fulva]WPV26170.1 hypothetical protein CLAFUW7_03672 [Fulvia fulva]